MQLTLMTNLLDAMIGQCRLVLWKHQLKVISARGKTPPRLQVFSCFFIPPLLPPQTDTSCGHSTETAGFNYHRNGS